MKDLTKTELDNLQWWVKGRIDKSKLKPTWVLEDLRRLIAFYLELREQNTKLSQENALVAGKCQLLVESNGEILARMEVACKEVGALEVKNTVQKEALDQQQEANVHNSKIYEEMIEQIRSLKEKYLSFICAECGAPTCAPFDSIDNGTSLTCKACSKDSVVSLRRVGEKDGEELFRVAEMAMAMKSILDDHNQLLTDTLQNERRPGDTLRSVVLRMKGILDLFIGGMALCVGYGTKPHKFVLVSAADGCPVCATLQLLP